VRIRVVALVSLFKMKTRAVKVGRLTLGAGAPFVLVAGPCVIENDHHPLFMARELKAITLDLGVPFIFKASYDKANRTSIDSFRGPGLEEGLAILREVQTAIDVPVTTDVHEARDVEDVGKVVDLLQIPAFLCRQTDLIVEAARTGKPLNIKKGQFLAPWDIVHAVEKARRSGNDHVVVTERGTTFGYNNLTVDFRGFPIIRREGIPLIFDVTHSLQLPGGAGASTGVRRNSSPSSLLQELPPVSTASSWRFTTTPPKALSDGPNSLPLAELAVLLKRLTTIDRAAREPI